MNNTAQSLRTVATGLGFVYAGLCLLVFSILLPLLVPYLGERLVGVLGLDMFIYLFLYGPLVLICVAMLLDMIGRLLCLAVPSYQPSTRPIVYVSVMFSLSALGIAAIQLCNLLFFRLEGPLVNLPPVLEKMRVPLALAGAVLFICFLRSLAQYVRKEDLASRAVVVLILGVVTVLAALATVMMVQMQRPDTEVGMAGLGMLVLGIVLLVLYGNLLTYLRKAVLQFAETQSPSGE